jgi:hypothetical protein
MRSIGWTTIGLLCTLACLGACRKPRPSGPLAPQLRGPVKDLAAVRAGNDFSLVWTMPAKNARRLAVNGRVAVRICWREAMSGPCNAAGDLLYFAPGASASFSQEFTPPLSSGPPRVVYFSVELMNRDGASTGLSNSVPTLAGSPPPNVEGLSAEMTSSGVLLRWTPDSSGYAIRIHRVRIELRPHTEGAGEQTPDIPPPEERDLLIEDGSRTAQVLDKDIRIGGTYSYSAQRIARFTIGKQSVELDSQLSNGVEIIATSAMHP